MKYYINISSNIQKIFDNIKDFLGLIKSLKKYSLTR